MIRLALVLMLLSFVCAPAAAADNDDLYQAQTAVTGQGEANRLLGFAACLTDVLVKVSGDLRLARDPRVAAMGAEAASLVRAFRYHDQMSGTPTRDEQGTRDRPYDLFVSFEPSRIDAALRSLGNAPWTGPRPRLVLFFAERNGPVGYVLARDGERGAGEREALAAAAAKRGLPIVLLDQAALAVAGVSEQSLETFDLARLDAAAKAAGGDQALAGRMLWSDQALAWTAAWRIALQQKTIGWSLRRATFDDVFRDALGGAAQILSGHGRPTE